MFACTNHQQLEDDLHKVVSIIDDDAELAYAKLDSISTKPEDMPENLRMKFYMLRADLHNRLMIDMSDDSLFHDVVDYYDHNGNSNEQLKAHYLLGCVYRDMKEAPIALQCYYDAVEKADTLSEDCDYRVLMSSWGQIAYVLYNQHVIDQQLVAWSNYSKYAKKLGNTYEYIRGIDLSTMAYSQLCDTAKVAKMTYELFDMYMDNGFEQEAYGVYPPLIDILISQGKYTEARKYMNAYESKSGLFVNGELESGRQLYHQTRGYYYLGTGNLDSAEICFRKLLTFDDSKYEAYRGLSEVFCERRILDSVISFSRLQDEELDAHLASLQIEAATNASSMYNYSRLQRIADEKRAEAKLNALLLTFAVFVFIVIVVAMYFLHKKFMAAKEDELVTLNDTYEKTKTEYVQAVENLTEQTEEYEQFKKEKLDEVESLKSKYNDLKSKDDEAALLNTPFINGIRDILKPLSPKPCMTNSDIEELLLVVREYLPHFFMEIAKDDKLSQQELLVCILLRLNFSGKDLSVLLNTSSSSIANAKKRANEKLFGMSQANMLITNLKNLGME